MKSILKRSIEPKAMVKVDSFGSTPFDGQHASTMELFWADGTIADGRGLLEWDIPTLEETEQIGIWTEGGKLTDYDGTINLLNEDMVQLLRDAGITVDREYYEDN